MKLEERGTLDTEILQDLYMVCFYIFPGLLPKNILFVGYNFFMVKEGIIISGKKAYALTWALQYVNLFMINVGYLILAGQALKVSSS